MKSGASVKQVIKHDWVDGGTDSRALSYRDSMLAPPLCSMLVLLEDLQMMRYP